MWFDPFDRSLITQIYAVTIVKENWGTPWYTRKVRFNDEWKKKRVWSSKFFYVLVKKFRYIDSYRFERSRAKERPPMFRVESFDFRVISAEVEMTEVRERKWGWSLSVRNVGQPPKKLLVAKHIISQLSISRRNSSRRSHREKLVVLKNELVCRKMRDFQSYAGGKKEEKKKTRKKREFFHEFQRGKSWKM